jgi:transcriptional regulator with XRE-family HTH domain
MSDGTSNPARYFGQQVRKARRAAGWTLREFGQRIGYDPGQISRIETGKRPPTELFAKMCDRAFPDRDGWFSEFYAESRTWIAIWPGPPAESARSAPPLESVQPLRKRRSPYRRWAARICHSPLHGKIGSFLPPEGCCWSFGPAPLTRTNVHCLSGAMACLVNAHPPSAAPGMSDCLRAVTHTDGRVFE